MGITLDLTHMCTRLGAACTTPSASADDDLIPVGVKQSQTSNLELGSPELKFSY